MYTTLLQVGSLRCCSSTIRITTLMQSVKKFLVTGIMEENNTVSFILGVDCCYNLPVKQFRLSYDSISFLMQVDEAFLP